MAAAALRCEAAADALASAAVIANAATGPVGDGMATARATLADTSDGRVPADESTADAVTARTDSAPDVTVSADPLAATECALLLELAADASGTGSLLPRYVAASGAVTVAASELVTSLRAE